MNMKKPWHGIMTILSIQHWRGGEVVWENRNIKNLLHSQGEEFIVNALFAGGRTSTIIPEIYHIGMDNRPALTASDTMDNIFLEPVGNGYSRQPVASSGDFSIVEQDSHWTAVSPLLVFSGAAATAGWGPVQNLFLTDGDALNGVLISSANIGTILTVGPQETITLQLSFSLLDCSPSTP